MKDKVVSYLGVGGSDWGTRVQCEHAMHALTPMWKVIDNEWYPWAKELIMDDSRLARVHQVGINLANAAKDIANATYQGEEGVCQHCHNKLFYLKPDSAKAICALCGIAGELRIEGEKVSFIFPEEQLGHAHDTLPGKFLHGDDIKNMEDRFAEVRQSDEFKARKLKYSNYSAPTEK